MISVPTHQSSTLLFQATASPAEAIRSAARLLKHISRAPSSTLSEECTPSPIHFTLCDQSAPQSSDHQSRGFHKTKKWVLTYLPTICNCQSCADNPRAVGNSSLCTADLPWRLSSTLLFSFSFFLFIPDWFNFFDRSFRSLRQNLQFTGRLQSLLHIVIVITPYSYSPHVVITFTTSLIGSIVSAAAHSGLLIATYWDECAPQSKAPVSVNIRAARLKFKRCLQFVYLQNLTMRGVWSWNKKLIHPFQPKSVIWFSLSQKLLKISIEDVVYLAS